MRRLRQSYERSELSRLPNISRGAYSQLGFDDTRQDSLVRTEQSHESAMPSTVRSLRDHLFVNSTRQQKHQSKSNLVIPAVPTQELTASPSVSSMAVTSDRQRTRASIECGASAPSQLHRSTSELHLLATAKRKKEARKRREIGLQKTEEDREGNHSHTESNDNAPGVHSDASGEPSFTRITDFQSASWDARARPTTTPQLLSTVRL